MSDKEIALITGGTSGLGKAQVYRWVKEGYNVVFCGRSVERGEEVAKETGAHFIKCDVSIAEDSIKMIAEIKEKFGRLDVLFNNSGVGPKSKTPERLDQISPEGYRKIMSINTDGQVYVMQAALKLMIEGKRGGRIVNMNSVCGITAVGAKCGFSTYSMTKYAITGLTRNTAIEYLQEKIRVNEVAPTFIGTDTVRNVFSIDQPGPALKAMIATIETTNPMLKHIEKIGIDDLPTESDVTGVVSFLVGPDSKFINGQTIPICGGYSIE